VFFLKLDKSALSVCTSDCGHFSETVFFDEFVLNNSKLGAHGVAKKSTEVSESMMYRSIVSMVEAAREHLLCKGHEIRGSIQVPVHVCPELARAAYSSLNFVYNHIDSKFFCQRAQALSKLIGEVVVPTLALDWLYNNSNDLSAFFDFPLLNF